MSKSSKIHPDALDSISRYVTDALRSDKFVQDVWNRLDSTKSKRSLLGILTFIIALFFTPSHWLTTLNANDSFGITVWSLVCTAVVLFAHHVIGISPLVRTLKRAEQYDGMIWLDTMSTLNTHGLGVRYSGITGTHHLPQAFISRGHFKRPILEHLGEDFSHFVFKIEKMHPSFFESVRSGVSSYLDIESDKLDFVRSPLRSSDFVEAATDEISNKDHIVQVLAQS